ncbi:hypothetical protein K505DRAFT_47583 [Melanomma pulvis-pyrius CBS 109.77]|uniref:Heterokaryon incompatibility domain-containing protein n=1 Tax=Melanomma pulvis-pyrius CBS 109.77 TaxID=1314802 RepID=A0A6A6XUA1_9PLEO|nr:hypothetical protein K505DRAFT_47583 [Melanomma pulvis-pyrius CBS 109.77]
MDYIPTPLSPLRGIDVPLMDVVPYDFKGLWEFPLRMGFGGVSRIAAGSTPSRIASLLQSWLYFGLLSEFLQSPVDSTEFAYRVEHPVSRLCIRITPIRKLLNPPYSKAETNRRRTLLEDVVRWLRHVENGSLCQQYTSPVIEITLSIRMLIYILAPLSGYPSIALQPHTLISKRLRDGGWCPSHIERIENMSKDIVGYYISCLRRPNPRGFSHIKCPTTNCEASSTSLSKDYVIRHTHPDSRPCPLVYVNENIVRQTIANGGIPLVSIELLPSGSTRLHVHAATSRDQFIAISHVWSDGLGNPLSNSLPKCQLDRLAMYLKNLPNPSSHAAFDNDFGPTFSFGPLSLDLARLSFICRKSDRPVLFWMDTLCIPVSTKKDDAWTNELKQRAINQMATIYGRASQVLVLDSSLQQCRIGLMNRSELLAHITFSNWMGRSWTLQEGALNPFVYFQFADGAVNLLDTIPSLGSSNKTTISVHPAAFRLVGLRDTLKSLKWAWRKRRTYQPAGSEAFPQFEQHIYETLHQCCMSSLHASGYNTAKNYFMPRHAKMTLQNAQWLQEFAAVWNALSLRTTTQAGDLPAIFANMLGLNAYAVLQLPPEQRMRAILGAGNELPIALLFNRGPRFEMSGDHRGRWIPTHLGRHYIEETPVMRFDSKRNLVMRTSEMQNQVRPTLLILPKCLHVEAEKITVMTLDGSRWDITLHREKDDLFDVKPYACTAFLIGKSTYQACCIRLLTYPETTDLEGVHDCPCTAEIVKPNTARIPENTSLLVEQFSSWSLTILGDTNSHLSIQPRIPRRRNFSFFDLNESVHWLLRMLCVWIPLVPLLITPTILRIYIATKCPWRTLSNIGRASLVTFVIQRFPSPLLFLPITQILFIVDLTQHGSHGLRSIGIAYAVLDLAWILYTGVACALMVQQWVQYRFEVSLSSLTKDWKQGKSIDDVWTRIKRRLPVSVGTWLEDIFTRP